MGMAVGPIETLVDSKRLAGEPEFTQEQRDEIKGNLSARTPFQKQMAEKARAQEAKIRLLEFIGQYAAPAENHDSLLRDLDVVCEESRLFGKGQAFSMAKDAINMELEKLMKPD